MTRPTRPASTLRCFTALAATLLPLLTPCSPLLHAQEVGPAAPAAGESSDAAAPTDIPQKLAWPRDEQRVLCRIGNEELTLSDLVDHLTERHDPSMRALMGTDAGRGFLESPLGASWVRQFADVRTLELEGKRRGLTDADVEAALSDALKRGFQAWLQQYAAKRASRGRPLDLNQRRINLLLADYQRRNGLGTEVQGWLDALVEATPLEQSGVLRDYYNDHPRFFGGVVTLQQIFIRNRDAQTLELMRGAGRQAAYDKLTDVRKRLRDDGANFADIARRFSDDRITAGRGGLMEGVKRFDDRLPAALCRNAWKLKDGEVSAPFESQFGIHIVRRLEYKHLYYVLFTDRIKDEVATTKRREEQENLLWDLRTEFGVQLRY